MTFVLLVLLSFFVLHEIDQVLKGRVKLYEKSAKRRVNYKGSFETGSSKVELSGYFFFFGDVTRSNPVLYHEYCIQDGNLVPRFSLLLLTLLLPVFTTNALLPIFPEESWILQWIRDTCGRGNFWIRREINVDSIISGYVWRGPEWTLGWLAIQWAVAKLYSNIWPSYTRSLFVSVTSTQSVQMILTLKRGQKGWGQQRTVFTNNEAPCFVSRVLYYDT